MDIVFFPVVHEVAIFGTTCVVLALATLWYSPLLFGALWVRVSATAGVVFDETAAGFWQQLATAFVVYLLQVAALAWLLAYAPVWGIAPVVLVGVLVGVVALATVPPVLYENRPWQYYVIHTSFTVVSLVVASVLIWFWPW